MFKLVVKLFVGISIASVSFYALAQSVEQTKGTFVDKFRQLDEVLPTPNVYRTASGAPGHQYWQQQADYVISVTLDDDNRSITGEETITYHNNSPDNLSYLWMQMDQNRFLKHSDAYKSRDEGAAGAMSYGRLRAELIAESSDGGYQIESVTDANSNPLPYTIVDTMMRIDTPLASGDQVSFNVNWSYNVVQARAVGARGGWEQWERDGNNVFFISQFYPVNYCGGCEKNRGL